MTQRATNKITIATPALLSVALRNISLRPQGRLITHCGAAAGRVLLMAMRDRLRKMQTKSGLVIGPDYCGLYFYHCKWFAAMPAEAIGIIMRPTTIGALVCCGDFTGTLHNVRQPPHLCQKQIP